MKPFQPSVAFLRYYEEVMAVVLAPISPGMGHSSVPMPNLPDIRERAFATTKLAPLIDQVNLYRDSVPALGSTTVADPYAVDTSGQPLYPEMWGTTVSAP